MHTLLFFFVLLQVVDECMTDCMPSFLRSFIGYNTDYVYDIGQK